MQQQLFRAPAASVLVHTREQTLNAPPRRCELKNCVLVPCNCAAPALDNRCVVEQPKLSQVRKSDKNQCCSPDFRYTGRRVHSPHSDAQLDVGPAEPASNPFLQRDRQVVSESQARGRVQAVIELCTKGELSRAVDSLARLTETRFRVSTSLLFRIIQRCGAEKNLLLGRRIDELVVKLGYGSNSFLSNHILRMYACQGQLEEAAKVFARVTEPNSFIWFSIISAQLRHGKPSLAIELYHEMRSSGTEPSGHVVVAALQACSEARDVESGRQVHSDLLKSSIQPNVFVWSRLVQMYAKCGELGDARKVFDGMASRDAVTWNAMINGYAEHGLDQEALSLYATMEQEDLILADKVTYSCLLKACASAGALQQGRRLHSELIKRGLLEGDIVVSNCLVNMYLKCSKLDDARMVFDSLATRDVVGWTAMINGYAEHGLGSEALALYAKMEQEGLILGDCFTFSCLLKACASAGALQRGRQLHSQIVERGLLEGNTVVGTCLVNMYAKCGKVEDARIVFESLVMRDVVAWTAMISGYAANNEGRKAIACIEEMMLAGIRPNDATFTSLLVACSHEGLVSEGQRYFDTMTKQLGLSPTIEHYNCMVDLLGRAGHTDEAEKMLLLIECENNPVGLMSLLNACKSHGDVERGARCFERLLRLDPQDASPYVLMANMYADAHRWLDVDRIERLRKLAGAHKKPAVARIEVNKQVQTFVVGEERDDISCKARSTNVRLKEEANHVPHIKGVLKQLAENEKEDELCGHAEKLALAYGLLNTPDGTPLLVTKNLRMCRDCHSSTEIMSRVEKRDIVVRDTHRVHWFEAGFCRCKGRH